MITNFNTKRMYRRLKQGDKGASRWLLKSGVYKGVDIGRLVSILEAKTDDTSFWLSLLPGASLVTFKSGYYGEDFYIYQDNGARLLGVCHLDTVYDWGGGSRTDILISKQGKVTVQSGALDDRLGVYFLVDWFARHFPGIAYDILLTTGEESGDSTAAEWCFDYGERLADRYNWVFEFDRNGIDAVTYHYGGRYGGGVSGAAWDDAIRRYIPVGLGSYSDICSLSLGVKGVNVGIGYKGEHSHSAHALLDDGVYNLRRFARFAAKQGGSRWDHAVSVRRLTRYDWGKLDDKAGGAAELTECWSCGLPLEWNGESYSCRLCGYGLDVGGSCEWCGMFDSTTVYRASTESYMCDWCYDSLQFAESQGKDDTGKDTGESLDCDVCGGVGAGIWRRGWGVAACGDCYALPYVEALSRAVNRGGNWQQ